MTFQYAAKLICGVSKEGPGLAHGTYETLINVHNPGKAEDFQYKLAVANEGADGKIYPFKGSKIEADGAQFYGCHMYPQDLDLAWPRTIIDGFFVIQSTQPLGCHCRVHDQRFGGRRCAGNCGRARVRADDQVAAAGLRPERSAPGQ